MFSQREGVTSLRGGTENTLYFVSKQLIDLGLQEMQCQIPEECEYVCLDSLEEFFPQFPALQGAYNEPHKGLV